jgi:hypothetical protein
VVAATTSPLLLETVLQPVTTTPLENKLTASVERRKRWPSPRFKMEEMDSVTLEGAPDELMVTSSCTAIK